MASKSATKRADTTKPGQPDDEIPVHGNAELCDTELCDTELCDPGTLWYGTLWYGIRTEKKEAAKTMQTEESTFVHEAAVRARYAEGAERVEPALCCPVSYDRRYLEVIPPEILERDYGCGDPSPYVRPGDTVLDLGSGGGKLCYIAAQLVGPHGQVIGVDCNDAMLSLARQYRTQVAERLGYANVDFRRGMIQDLALDLDRLAEHLVHKPITNAQSWLELRDVEERLRREHPLVASASVDCVVSNCVLNLVRPGDRERLFSEVFRVLRPGGRVAISDIVADEDVPEKLRNDPELWSGCISGAYREDEFLAAFEAAGFHGLQIAKRDARPWRVVSGIEFRAITVLGYKAPDLPPRELHQALIYRGPFKQVTDDQGQVYYRGARMAVSDQTLQRLTQEPYRGMFESIEPNQTLAPEQAKPFTHRDPTLRLPKETKGATISLVTISSSGCCDTNSSCC